MQKYNGQLIRQFASNTTGNAASGVTVTVRRQSDDGLATLYVDNNIAGATLSNPITTTSTGHFAFYAADGVYTLTFSDSTPAQIIQLQDVGELQAQFDAAVLNAGYIPSGTFSAGATLTQANQVLSDGSSYWRWDGSFPKTVTAGSAPTPTGVSNWILVSDQALRGDLAAVGSDVLIGDVEAGKIAESSMYLSEIKNSPALLDQFVNYLGGRGMLSTETPSIATERFITSSTAKGATGFAVGSSTNIVAGGRVVIYHSVEDVYESYFVNSVSGSTIGLSAGLKYATVANSCKVERLWYNQPHPGKFYMRMLAQKIARLPEYETKVAAEGRIYFSQFDSNPTDANDTAVAFGGAGVSYVNELNISQGLVTVPLESMIGRSLFITGSANGFGASLPTFNAYANTDAVLSVVMMARDPSISIEVQIVDTDGFVQTVLPISNDRLRVMTKYSFSVKLSGRTKEAKIQIVAVSGVTGSTSIIVDQVELYKADAVSSKPIIDKTKPCKIVGLGDSWIAGDTITTPERESILTQLGLELPNATIINAGIGGQKVWQMYDRFETDVAVHNPDYVIVNTGTNDCYSPISGVFFPNSVDQFERYYNMLIGKIMAIGAKPIIIGVPALAEADGSFSSWALNDRAKTYHRYFSKRISRVFDYSQSVAPEPTVIAFTPSLKIGGSTTGITYTTQKGNYTKNNRVVTFTAEITLSSKGSSTGTVTVTLPPISAINANVTPISMTCANVVSALGMQAVVSISTTNELRFQIPSATGTAAATEANIANNSTFWIAGSYLTNA